MRFEILPNLFLLPTTEFNDWKSEITPTTNENCVIAVILATTFNPDSTNNTGSNNKKKINFFCCKIIHPPTQWHLKRRWIWSAMPSLHVVMCSYFTTSVT